MLSAALVSLSLASAAFAQLAGNVTAEVHPKLSWQECSRNGGCSTKSSASVTLDANWRWVHVADGFTNCYTGNSWNSTVCTNGATCSQKCALEGGNYQQTYGITASGNSLTLKFVTKSEGTNVGSRVYLMEDDNNYQMFNLLNKEFTFDVDVSKLPCGLNGALYFVQMDKDGGKSKYASNKAGAKFGTGYCDSQCPRDIKYINGEANVEGWNPSPNSPNSGKGTYGACCAEMDIWEANSISSAYTPHPCKTTNEGGYQRCSGTECNNPRYEGLCDPDGCDFNSFRQGDTSYYGPGKTIDTNKKMTVVTQFITDNNSTTGNLVEIRRLYVQDGKVYANSKTNQPGQDALDSVTDKFCDAQKTAFNDRNRFKENGGLVQMGKSLGKGHVLVLSIWDDYDAQMLWLDSQAYPIDANPSTPGVARGTCATTSGKPSEVEAASPDAQVIFSNIKFGDIGSTFTGTPINPPVGTSVPGTSNPPVTPTTSRPPATTTAAPGGQQTQWGQCGGTGYSGPTTCASPYTCHKINDFYSQCY
ncbi:cellulase [Coprinopsis sp. MPI-PUGE-AT-0042]|nr:cellulase [Coprinopsis sp. MPI-PUGE-AT-0042]